MQVLKRVALRLLKSKRVWALAAGFLTPLLNQYLGLGLSEAEVIAMISAIIAAILGDSLRPIDPEKAAEDDAIKETNLRDRLRDRLGRN